MNRHSLRKLQSGVSTCLAVLVFGSCSNSNEGANLQVAVQPSNDVLMGVGPQPSCIDSIAAKTATTAVTPSVSGPVMTFNNFQLEWTSPDTLYLQEIRWTIVGSGISGGTFQAQVASDEIAALVALSGGIVPGVAAGATPTVINSNDSTIASRTTGLFAPCGLVLGGIPLADPKSQVSFRAHVEIEVIGTATDSSGNQRYVRQIIRTQARYDGS